MVAEKGWSRSCFKQLKHGENLGSDRLDLNASADPAPKEGIAEDPQGSLLQPSRSAFLVL